MLYYKVTLHKLQLLTYLYHFTVTRQQTKEKKKDSMMAATSSKTGSSFKICVGERESGVKMKFRSPQIGIFF